MQRNFKMQRKHKQKDAGIAESLEEDSGKESDKSLPWLNQRGWEKEREKEVVLVEQMELGLEAEFEKLTFFTCDHK